MCVLRHYQPCIGFYFIYFYAKYENIAISILIGLHIFIQRIHKNKIYSAMLGRFRDTQLENGKIFELVKTRT